MKRNRKEATQADLRKFAKQFKEAKVKEYESWRAHDVFDLVDTRKFPAKTMSLDDGS